MECSESKESEIVCAGHHCHAHAARQLLTTTLKDPKTKRVKRLRSRLGVCTRKARGLPAKQPPPASPAHNPGFGTAQVYPRHRHQCRRHPCRGHSQPASARPRPVPPRPVPPCGRRRAPTPARLGVQGRVGRGVRAEPVPGSQVGCRGGWMEEGCESAATYIVRGAL